MSHYARIYKASSLFFFSGFVVSKIQYLPVGALITPIINSVALAMYFLGYLLWYIGSYFNPDHPGIKEQWFGFAEFKEQYRYAAAVGTVATILGIIAVFFPVITIPSVWLFLVSNVIWTISEFHILKNPPAYDEKYSAECQEIYLHYALSMTAIALVVALSTTLAFSLPAFAVPIFLVSSILCIGLGAFAFEKWLDYTFGKHPITPVSDSYEYLQYVLGRDLKPSNDNSTQPTVHTDLFKTNTSSLLPQQQKVTCNPRP